MYGSKKRLSIYIIMSIPVTVTYRGHDRVINVDSNTTVRRLIMLSLIAFDLSARCWVWALYLPTGTVPLPIASVPDYITNTAFILRRLRRRPRPRRRCDNNFRNNDAAFVAGLDNGNNNGGGACWGLLAGVILLGGIVWLAAG